MTLARTAALALLMLLAAALPVRAETPHLTETVAAIGRFNHAGFRDKVHCTATLIAPDRAVTAAHCLPARGIAGNAHFLPGRDPDGWIEALALLGWTSATDGRDLATLCLAPAAQTLPMRRSTTGPIIGETLTIIGYGLPSRYAQSRLDCAVAAVGGTGAFTLDCPVRPGMSGAPVMRETPEGQEIVGVMSATGTDRSRASDISGGSVLPDCDR